MDMAMAMAMGSRLGGLPAAPVITTSSLSSGTNGVAYSETLAVTGTSGGTWSVASGSLPSGLSLNASTGEISGTPDTVETANFTVRYTDPFGQYDDRALSIEIVSSYAVQWTDDFERADSATVGGDWTEDGTETQYHIASGRLNRDTTLGAPGGAAWVASGAAVASAKPKLKIELKNLKAAGTENVVQFGFLDAAVKITGAANGYIIRRYLNTVVKVSRVLNGSLTDLGTTYNVGLAANGSSGADVALEVEQSGTSVIIRVYAGGSQVGADLEDATPGNAANIFTGSAYPGVRSPVHDWNGHSCDSIEVSY